MGASIPGLQRPQDHWQRIYLLTTVRSLFDSNNDALDTIRALATRIPGDVDAEKVRSFAASAGDTISEDDAFKVIRDIAERRVSENLTDD